MDGDMVGGQMSERDSVMLVVNMQSARIAAEKVVVEIGKWWYFVSVRFVLLVFGFDGFPGVKQAAGPHDAREAVGTFHRQGQKGEFDLSGIDTGTEN